MESHDDFQERKEYLIKLLSEVSLIRRGSSTLNISGHTYPVSWRDCERPLTEEEFGLFMEYAPYFIVEPTNAQSGFNFGVRLYDFPKTKDESPQPFFFISGEYLPETVGQLFEDSWRVLSPLSHNKTNERLLRSFGLELPREKYHYEY